MTVHNTGEIHDLLADIYERRKDYKNALLEYQEATSLDPDNDRFAFDLGSELLLHENYQAAETILRAAQARNPQSSQIYLALGAAEFMAGKTADSVDAFLKAVDLNPNFEPAYLFLGEAYTFSGARSEEVLAKLAHLAAKRATKFWGTVLLRHVPGGGDEQRWNIDECGIGDGHPEPGGTTAAS